ncbi:MAG: ABC transporter substrate-binding protein [Anaerolineae bacterium]|nr:ABC transporter substrate-binding protein [Anaerolineae bacterium]
MKSKTFVNGWLCAAVIGAGLLSGCASRRPILVGFAGELSGKNADLGTHGRDGAQLAVETLNATDGIAGRPIELLVRDDLGTPEGARAADRELIDAGVVAIIGHMTSGQSMAALPVTEEAGVVLLSPTTSTTELSGLDDHFFRVNPVNALAARTLARHIYQHHSMSRMAAIYDTDNAAYTKTFWTAFAEAYRALSGQVTGEAAFSSAGEPDFAPLVAELQATGPDGLLIIASALDTALIAQQTRLSDWQIPLFASSWAQTETLPQNGGQAVEGIEIVMQYDSNSQKSAFLEFRAHYQERFGRAPTFAAAQAYEAVLVLAAALEKTGGQAEGLPQALLETQSFEGLVGTISLDEYGDVVRTQFLVTVQDGQFVTLAALEPEEPE